MVRADLLDSETAHNLAQQFDLWQSIFFATQPVKLTARARRREKRDSSFPDAAAYGVRKHSDRMPPDTASDIAGRIRRGQAQLSVRIRFPLFDLSFIQKQVTN
jgi:hypothetical protein